MTPSPYHFLLDRIPAAFREAAACLAEALVAGVDRSVFLGVTDEQQAALEQWHAALAAARAWAALQGARQLHVTTTAPARQFAAAPGPLNVGTFFSLPFDEALLAYLGRHPEIMIAPEDLYELYWERGASLAEAAAAMLQRDIYASLADALRVGVPLTDWRKQAAQDFGRTASHWETVYRTNVAQAYSDGQRVQAQNYPDVIGFRRLTTRDATTRPNHRAAHGFIYRKDDPRADWYAAPFGFNCILEGERVQGRFDAAARSVYRGKAVKLVTKHGAAVAVTANHPVLTTDGMVAAGSLKRGCKLLRYVRPVVDTTADALDKHEMPARVEEVFRALAERGGVSAMRSVADDFHGEATRFVGDVEIVGAYRELANRRASADRKHAGDAVLVLADANDGLHHAKRPVDHRRIGHRGPAHGVVSRLDLAGSLVGGHPGPLEALCFGMAATIDAVLDEQSGDGSAGMPGFIRECLDRYPGQVAVDEVESARAWDFCGHVYDLQSPVGFIVAGDICIGNCRCTDQPVTRAMARRLGVEFDDNGDPVLPPWPEAARPDEGFK